MLLADSMNRNMILKHFLVDIDIFTKFANIVNTLSSEKFGDR